MLTYIVVFIITLVVDIAWTKYILASGEKQADRAALWSAIIIILGGLNTINIVNNHWMLIPAALGAWTGTYWTVNKEKNKTN